MQFFVGGAYELANLDGITAGASYDATPSTTLSSDIDKDDDSIPVASTTGFPSAGAIVVWPSESYERYEIIHYGSKTGSTFDEFVAQCRDGGLRLAVAVSRWQDRQRPPHWPVELADDLLEPLLLQGQAPERLRLDVGDWPLFLPDEPAGG